MIRVTAAAGAALALALASPAHADPYQVGAFFGPRIFSKDAQLGNVPGVDDTLDTTVVLGLRGGHPVWKWLAAEVELPLATTSTTPDGIDVFWLEPRAQVRFTMRPRPWLRPFAVVGAGMPVTLSQKRGYFASGLTGEGYGGLGVILAPRHGINLRLDVRVGVQPGLQYSIEPETEVTIGLWLPVGGHHAGHAGPEGPPAPADRDGDGIADDVDKCPDRPEDKDDFEDADGCPDIDNDGDEVLDVSDACPLEPETFNGFKDDDGCPDTVPDEVDAIRGTVEGLLYAPGEIEVRPSAAHALDRIAATMKKYPSILVLATGFTDDREAAPAKPPADRRQTRPTSPSSRSTCRASGPRRSRPSWSRAASTPPGSGSSPRAPRARSTATTPGAAASTTAGSR